MPGDEPVPAMRLADIPCVFLSYDEPWADAYWGDLRRKAPKVERVHGVLGLDASHKAAAKKAGSRFFLTVDADTLVDEGFFDQEIPDHLISRNLRPTWYSRNAVNGLVSGNGALKLWSRDMVRDMRSHEAAPDDQTSLDHEVEQIYPGRSFRVVMPGCYSVTNPGMTPYHAFRCGLREGVYLSQVGRAAAEWPQGHVAQLRLWKLIEAWGSLGQHAANGLWMIYGARLGRWFSQAHPDWDPRAVNDYRWLSGFWTGVILPRFSPGGTRCPWTDTRWDKARLLEEVEAMGRRMPEDEVRFAELDPAESAVATSIEMPVVASASVGPLGWSFLKGKGVRADVGIARSLFEVGAALGHAGSVNNLARLHDTSRIADADLAEAERLYVVATALGDRAAPYHLARLIQSDPGRAESEAERIDSLLGLAVSRGHTEPVAPDIGVPRSVPNRVVTFGDLDWIRVDQFASGNEPLEAVERARSDLVLVIHEGVEPSGSFRDLAPDPVLRDSGLCTVYPVRNAVTGGYHAAGVMLCSRKSMLEGGAMPVPDLVVPFFVGEWVPDRTPFEAFRSACDEARRWSGQGEPAEAALWASIGADRPNGLWWILGAGLGLLERAPPEAVWDREQRRPGGLADLQRRVHEVARRVRVDHGIPVRPLGARGSGLVRGLMPVHPPEAVWRTFVASCAGLGGAASRLAASHREAADRLWGPA